MCNQISIARRVSKTIADWGRKGKYFNTAQAKDFQKELFNIQFEQRAAFNSPVYYNMGIQNNPQCSACFILGCDDSIDGIMDTQALEVKIYKGGSGAGVSYDNLRSSHESLTNGGVSSGPIPFIRGIHSQGS